ncbi:CBS domain-containing protein [Hydrogenophaga palleronii]|uniref:CBS domain-containing protein n=1 Tax=Hydrogenophaga palleronii TaxID=65655 RepID=UPI00286D4F18|nr:CBS domain-containing protein [Hydrogenophaga palleronii]
MSRELITVNHRTPLQDAYTLFRRHHIKAMPVVDAAGHIVGIVTPADFMRANEAQDSGLSRRGCACCATGRTQRSTFKPAPLRPLVPELRARRRQGALSPLRTTAAPAETLRPPSNAQSPCRP